MNPDPTIQTRYQPPGAAVRIMMILLAAGALAVSGFLLWLTWGKVPGVIGCAPGSGCSEVLASAWSVIGPIPVALPAVITYLLVLILLVRNSRTKSPKAQVANWLLLIVLAGGILAAAAWFTFVQYVYIDAFCKYCMAAHAMGVLLAVNILFAAPIGRPRLLPDDPPDPVLLAPAGGSFLMLVGILLTVGLISAQIMLKPPSLRVEILQGQVNVDLLDAPILGRPHAQHHLILLYDYNCIHCRDTHGLLKQAMQQYGDSLSVVMLPTPLNSKCNPEIQHDDAVFENSCELAQLALAVWHAEPQQFAEIDRYLFDTQHDLTTDQAWEYAGSLVDSQALRKAYESPWVQSKLELAVELFRITQNERGDYSGLPKMIVNGHYLPGRPSNVEELRQVLDLYLMHQPTRPPQSR